MVGYRCYLLDAEDHILQAHEFECEDDAAAELVARNYLDRDPYHRAAELWERARRIIKLDRDRQAALAVLQRAKHASRPLGSVA